MSLMVKDCLMLPSLRNATVVAGKKGANRIVNTVSVLEITDEIVFDFEHIDNGALCLSSFFNIKDNPHKQCQLIESMHNNGDACVVLYYVGIYLKKLDQTVIDLADKLDFPIIVMPENRIDLFYSEVISEISDAIHRDKNSNKNYVDNITALVSTLPENKKNLSSLMKLLSDNLQCSLLLTDMTLSNTALSTWPVSNDISPEDIVRLYNSASRDEEIKTTVTYIGQSLDIYKLHFTSFELRNYQLFGVDASDKLSIDDMYQVIEILQIFSRLWDMDTESIFNGRFISFILDGNIKKATSIAEHNHIEHSTIDTLVIIRPNLTGFSIKEQQKLLSDIVKSLKKNLSIVTDKAIIDAYSQYTILLLSKKVVSSLCDNLTDYIEPLINEHTNNYTISAFYLDGSLDSIHRAYMMYNNYIEKTIKLFPNCRTISQSQILFFRHCETIIKNNGDDFRSIKQIIRLLHTNRESKHLLETLQTYFLDCNCNIKKTAQTLYTHRNTIQYRLNAIYTATKLASGDSFDRWLLQVAAACYRFNPTIF